MRALLTLAYAGVPALLVAVSVWRAAHQARRDVPDVVVSRVRAARLTGLGAGLILGIAAVWSGQALLTPAAVAAGYLFGVLLAELLGAPRPSGSLRIASLQTRRIRSYLPVWSMPVALCAAVLAIAAPVILAMLPAVRYGSPAAGDQGSGLTLPAAALHWPVAACVPLAVVAVLGLAAGGLALRRAPWLPPVTPGQPEVDERIRRSAARAVAGAVIAIELFVLAAEAILASDGLAVPAPVNGHLYLGSRIFVWSGISLAAMAVAVWCRLGRWKGTLASLPAATRQD